MAFKDKFSKFFGFGSSNDNADETKAPQVNDTADDIDDLSADQVENADDVSISDDEYNTVQEDVVAENNEPGPEAEDVFEVENNIDTEESFQAVNDDEDNSGNITESEETMPEDKNIDETETEEPKGFFAKLKTGLQKTRASINDKLDSVIKMFKKIDEDLYEELEEALIMADVGVDTSLYIISELRKKVKEKKITEAEDVKGEIEEIISEILCRNDNSLCIESSPSVIMVIGVNGVGKTTSIGKLAARLKAQGKNVILGAADTFRAAAIDQLAIWAERSDIDIIKHQEGSDPAAVVFDTIAAAKARKSDVIILDTAGRLHNKKNLMDELNKISRVIERELPAASRETLLVLDATTGQNAVTQAELFCQSASITGIILTKLDGSAKGGIVLAISHEQEIPVKLIGVGEGIDDLQAFDSESFAKALFTE